MDLIINGKAERCDGGLSMADLLRTLDLEPIRVAVEVNKELVPRGEFARTTLHDGDHIEIVTFVGGG